MDKNTVDVYKNGKAVTIDKDTLAVFLKFGYELKDKQKAVKEEK